MKWLALLALVWSVAGTDPLHAQKMAEGVPDWQKAAGGEMAFEVASVRLDNGPFKPPSFALSSDEWFREPNGRFHADFALPTYIQFAWKIWLTGEERGAVFAKLPEWVKTWATTEAMSRYHHSAGDVPNDLSIPRWSWDGLQK